MQIHDLGLENFSTENAQRIGNSIGEHIETYKEVEILSNIYLWLKVEVDTEKSPMDGFLWKNSQANETWDIKYERLWDFCYGCGRLGHTTQSSKKDVTMYEIKEGRPMYGPWLIGRRPKNKMFSQMREGREKGMPKPDRNPRWTWFNIMNVVSEQKDGKQHDDPNIKDPLTIVNLVSS